MAIGLDQGGRLSENCSKGHVKLVETVANPVHLGDTTKAYTVTVAIDNDKNPIMPGIGHGMSAEVTIDVDRKTGVVRVPVKAVVHADRTDYCYLKVGKEIQKREVKLGLRNGLLVEITAGVKEGDAVLRDVDNALRLLSPFLDSPELSPQKLS